MESKILVRTLKPGGGWIPLGGQIIGEPAVFSRRPDITDVFARGTDNMLWQKSWDRDHWTEWTPHNDGFILDSSPVADSMGPDHVHVFARGQDGQLWQKWWTAEAGWGTWTPLGGQIIGAPAVRSRRPDITDVFARGTDNLLWQKSWDRDHWTEWTPHNDGFILDSSPVADSMAPEHVHIFARGRDGQLWQKWWTAALSWSGEIHSENELAVISGAHPGIADWFSENWQDIAVAVGAGVAAYYTGNPELAAAAKSSATNVVNSIGNESDYNYMARSGRPYGNSPDYKQIAVIYMAWSEDSLKPETCKVVYAPPEARPYSEELQDKSYVVGYVLDTNTLLAGKTYPFIFGAQDDGWHNDVAVLNEVDIYFS